MYLVMTEEKATPREQIDMVRIVGGTLSNESYDGESTNTIRKNLEKDNDSSAIVTADSRFLMFVGDVFPIENVFISRNGRAIPISETTNRILKRGHNLMKLYDAGEFTE